MHFLERKYLHFFYYWYFTEVGSYKIPVNDQSALVQVMTCCRKATSHYLCQCWPRSLSPYGVTRPQCVDTIYPDPSCWLIIKHHWRIWANESHEYMKHWYCEQNKTRQITHWGRVTHICVSEIGHHWFRQGLVIHAAPSHWHMTYCKPDPLENKLRWHLNDETKVFFKNAFEYVCKVAAILSRSRCFNGK